jgi:uncharacterized protein YqfB (UPF0267 family)
MSKSPWTRAILITAAITAGCGSNPAPATPPAAEKSVAATFPSTLPVMTGMPPAVAVAKLRFAAPSLDMILAGTKTGTARLAKGRTLGTGHLDVTDGSRTIGVTVTSVTHKKFNQLTPEDARAEGVATLDALRAKLMKDYPGIAAGDEVMVVKFTLPPGH